jgi:Zn-dependent protease
MDERFTPPALPPSLPRFPGQAATDRGTLRLPQPPTLGQQIRKYVGPAFVAVVVILKYGAKLKFIAPLLKFVPVVLKTGGSMVLTIWVYAMAWGVWFAVGFVLLILVHECGHLVAARRIGLKVGAPVFIPFMGAFIALKEAPKDAWIEAQVGIGGPLLGTLGAAACALLHLLTGNPLFGALAYTGFFLNLFNLAPIGFLDGGRIVTALSPWLWLVGLIVAVLLMLMQFNFLLLLIVVMSLPRLGFLFRKKTDEEKRYFEVTPERRWAMATLYFGLIAFLVFGMQASYVETGPALTDAPTGSQAHW